MEVDVKKILEGVGVKTEAFERIRLGRGVVGKISYLTAAALLVMAVLALRATGADLLVATLVATVVIFLAALCGILWFANKHPGVALLEGAELIQWKRMDMGLKGEEPSLLARHNVEQPVQVTGPRGHDIQTARLYNVTLHLAKTPANAQKLDPIFSSIGHWARLNMQSWFIWATLSADEIYEKIRTNFHADDSIMITEISEPDAAYGWAPEWFWTFLSSGWQRVGED